MKNFALLLFLMGSNLLHSQQVVIEQSEFPPKLDGYITADEYNAADSVSGLFQIEPFIDQSASERTVAYFTYNDETIFIGIKCYDSTLNEIVRSIQTRDQLGTSDDAIFVVIDPYNDKRSAFGFGINAINTQTDFRIRDDGRSIDYNWDEEWESYASISEDGWYAEIAIPFSSLTYNDAIENWEISLRRVIKKNSEISYRPVAPTYEYQISKNGLLIGLKFPKITNPFGFTPYATLRYENTEATGGENKLLTEFGKDSSLWKGMNSTEHG